MIPVRGAGIRMVARPLPAEAIPRAKAFRSWNQLLMSRDRGIIPAQL